MTSAESRPLTVFTPFYTHLDYFDQCIESVLSQSFADFEYLMINDGPEENARRIERAFSDPRLRIITTEKRLGLSASRNRGLREARGELIAFIDADDFCEPGRFRKQIDFLNAHRDHALVGTALRFIDDQSRTIGERRYPENDAEIRSRLVIVNCIAQPSVMARRQVLIEAGGYTEDFAFAEDYDLWLRVAGRGKLHNLPEQLVAYRIHQQSGKNLRLRAALRDTTRVKVAAIRRYGFRATPRALFSIAAHALLMMLPARVVFWLFKKAIVTRTAVSP